MRILLVLLLVFLFVSGCCRQAFEMEALAEEVLKDKGGRGVEIEVKPIPKN